MTEFSDNIRASCSTDESYGEFDRESVTESPDSAVESQPELIERRIVVILLKLEHIFHIPAKGVDELLEELHFLLSSASLPLTKRTITDIFKSHNLHIGQAVIEELANSVCISNPVAKFLGKCGPLATSYKRKLYCTRKILGL